MSKIEWTGETWNPVVGCSIITPGCTNCYAMKMADRIQRMNPESHYRETTRIVNGNPVWTGELRQAPEHIRFAPLRWSRPRMVFVNSMSDLFHERMPEAWIDEVFAVMALCPQHTFQVLTKRHDRMQTYMTQWPDGMARHHHVASAAHRILRGDRIDWASTDPEFRRAMESVKTWPLPNVWLGVSTENQQCADMRVPYLLRTPAAVRFVSAEPLLGLIRFNHLHEGGGTEDGGRWDSWESALNGRRFDIWSDGDIEGCPKLDWIIVGGESGDQPRAFNPEWARRIRDDCHEAGVPFFMKQMAGRKSAMPPIPDDLMIRQWPRFGAYNPA